VPGDRCGNLDTQRIQLTIAKLPNAPAVRSVAVSPRSVRFGFCGSATGAFAYVDGDPGISQNVTWQSDDTTVVAVSAAGMVRVRSHGTTKVRAVAAADTTVVGYLTAQVDPTCA
jgi:hypothetical protein